MIGSGIFLGAAILSAAIMMSVAAFISKDRSKDNYAALYVVGLLLALLTVAGGYNLIDSEFSVMSANELPSDSPLK